MHVNNETGAILEMPRAKKTHSDATQAVGKIPFDARKYDFVSMSAHKFYGPKGVGALYIKGAQEMEPLLFGGEQEHGRPRNAQRSGNRGHGCGGGDRPGAA